MFLSYSKFKEVIVINENEINEYIKKIPPMSDSLSKCLIFLNQGELAKASAIAQEEISFLDYMKDLVNKPIYGFKNEVKELPQIFSILGIGGSKKALYAYMISLLSPNKWEVFKLNKTKFTLLQDILSVEWKKILKYRNINDNEIESSISLLPSSVILAEALFVKHLDDVKLLKQFKDINYNEILMKMTSKSLFDLSVMIGKKWNISEKSYNIVYNSSGKDLSIEDDLAKMMHLLLFYVLSKPEFMDTKLNDFIEFKVDYVQSVYEDFNNAMEVS